MGVLWGFRRGHKIIWNPKKDDWFYADTGELVTNIDRPCIRCGEKPTKEGHDACLGNLPNVKFACCGHGVKEGYRTNTKEKP